jgi:hypothetical protein
MQFVLQAVDNMTGECLWWEQSQVAIADQQGLRTYRKTLHQEPIRNYSSRISFVPLLLLKLVKGGELGIYHFTIVNYIV